MSTVEAELESVLWDLDPLVDGDGEAGCDRLLDEAAAEARRLSGAR